MLYATADRRRDKRVALRDGLASGRLLRLPGAFNPLSARLIEDKGFDGVYVSGAVLAADLGLPDIGLTTATEVTQRAGQIARMTDLPAIVDADTGFGEPMNVARTVQGLEDAGAGRLPHRGPGQPEALRPPRRQGRGRRRHRAQAHPGRGRRPPRPELPHHGPHRRPRPSTAWRAAIDRAKALVDAGADAIFPEALTGPDEFEAVRAAVDVPLLANMTEFGKGELLTARQLEDIGMQHRHLPGHAAAPGDGRREAGPRHHPRRGHARPACWTGCRRAPSSTSCSTTRPTASSTRTSSTSRSDQHARRTVPSTTMEAHRMTETDTQIHKGLAGVVVDTTEISSVDAESNSLLYRGYPVQQLAAQLLASRRSRTCCGTASCPTPTQLAELQAAERVAAGAGRRRGPRRARRCPPPATRWTWCAPR